jgi:hypothetical protein
MRHRRETQPANLSVPLLAVALVVVLFLGALAPSLDFRHRHAGTPHMGMIVPSFARTALRRGC